MLETYIVPLKLKEKVKQIGYSEIDRVRQLRFWRIIAFVGWILFFVSLGLARAEYTNDQIADAIYLAEGGARAKVPYGILSVKVKDEAEARRVCLNTIRNNRIRFTKQNKYTDFIEFLGSRYCPVLAHKLNRNWVKNVKYWLATYKKLAREGR